MKVIFMGTPDFAVPALCAVCEAGHEVVLAVTQPDRPKGRGGKVAASPVKEAAIARGIPVFQPGKLRDPENIAFLSQYQVDVIVVVAFGQILPKAVLDLPKYCCVNVHGSLLPKYRGASPIQWTVLNGDPVGGVTTMRMDEGLDTGDMILKQEIPLAADETAATYFDKVAQEGAALLVETLSRIEDGTAVYTKQDEGAATKTGMIRKSMGEIDFGKSAREIDCLIRGMNPWPTAYTRCGGKLLKIWRVEPLSMREAEERFSICGPAAAPGTVLKVTKKELVVAAADSALNILELQAEGKKRMETAAFLRGFRVQEGEVFGG